MHILIVFFSNWCKNDVPVVLV